MDAVIDKQTGPSYQALWYALLGAAAGYALLHPASMVIWNITDYAHGWAPLAPLAAIRHSLSRGMWPMSALYALLGAVFGYFYGLHTARIWEQQQRLREDLEEIRSLAARLDYERRVVKLLDAGYRHSWKNKLLGILGFAQRLERQDVGPAVRTSADMIRRCGESLFQELTTNLEVSKILSTDTLPLARGDVHGLLVCCVHGLLETRFAAKDLRVAINGEPWHEATGQLEWAYNATTLRHVVENVLSNAMQFGSRVDIRYGTDGCGLIIEVSDDGPGMSADELAAVFDPTVCGEHGGTHVGMAYSKMIIEKHEGQITYCTAEGQGTCCLISLPAPKADGPSPSRLLQS